MGRSGERIGRLCPEPGRMRCRRLRVYSYDPRRPQGDLRTANRQDSTDAAVIAGPSISRIKKIIFSPPSKCPIGLFGPVANRAVLERPHPPFPPNGRMRCPVLLSQFWVLSSLPLRTDDAAPATRLTRRARAARDRIAFCHKKSPASGPEKAVIGARYRAPRS